MGTPHHHITLCTTCPHTGDTCRVGYDLIKRLRSAIEAAGDTITDAFEISGTACMEDCVRPCTLTYHSTRDASYLFAGVTADDDIYQLVEFAQSCAQAGDHWPGHQCDASQHQLAHEPSMMLAVEAGAVALS
ncbi:Predicted metal-binding protein [Aliiroseovarius halocynthiae]|uniref:DUF1636 domain-containing protein n=1 Tax=Aliiroseovarius halocynthiae TaxID=985055 RepID=A0A545SQ77_9RHOB|nr:DUF1636 family protein [Aliiroseovarius halocynthiae]TQV67135.1 DUF1636 domain-containing protein [Aliiroseovarius halocynthiae]SMR82137.1 Predicted metal-binding protein [Aliiroseovarius halocynthiae]